MHLQGHYSESPATTPRAKSPEIERCHSTHTRGSSTQISTQQVQQGSAAQARRVPLPEESAELENHCGIHIQGCSVQSCGVLQRVHSEQLHQDPSQVTDNVNIKHLMHTRLLHLEPTPPGQVHTKQCMHMPQLQPVCQNH